MHEPVRTVEPMQPNREIADRVRRRFASALARLRGRRGTADGGSTPVQGLQRTPTLGGEAPGAPADPRRRRPRLLPRRRWLRRLILWGGGATLAVAVVTVSIGTWLYSGADINTVGDLDFANRLKIPPVLEPDTDAKGARCSTWTSTRDQRADPRHDHRDLGL